MISILKETKSALTTKAIIIKVDVSKNQKVALAFQVRAVPTLILFKQGKIIWKQSGVVPANELILLFKKYK